MRRVLVLAVILLAVPHAAGAHPFAPALLQLEEVSPDQIDVSWKQPAVRVQGSRLRPVLPPACTGVGDPVVRQEGVFRDYARLGVQHILTGWDHLVFVLGLVLLVGWGSSLLWTVTAFTLGHSVSLPSAEIPLALFSFNVGIELGQLAFLSCVVAAGAALRRLSIAWPRPVTAVPAYAIGSLAIYWMLERIAGL